MKHWNLQFVLQNMKECDSSYKQMSELPSFITEQSYFESNQKMTDLQ